jgi:uncharacterized RDD family membrane protein YckC
MKCPKCGFVSFNYLNNCKRCGMDLVAYKKRKGISAEPAPPAAESPLKKKMGKKLAAPSKLRQDVSDSSRRTPVASGERAASSGDAGQGIAQDEARRIRDRIEREAMQRAEKIQRKIEDNAHAEALNIRIQQEREARENAEKIRREIEADALERAEKMRAEIERDARERAERIRQETQRVAREEAEKFRNDSEREALAHAEEIRRRTEIEAQEKSEEIRRRFEREALDRSAALKLEREEAEKFRNESEREALAHAEEIRRRTEIEAQEKSEEIRRRLEREAQDRSAAMKADAESEAKRLAENILVNGEREAQDRSAALKADAESEAKKLAENILVNGEREAKTEIAALRALALKEAEKLKAKALAEATEMKKEAEEIAKETIENAFAEVRRGRESWFDNRVSREKENAWETPALAQEDIGGAKIDQDNTQRDSEEALGEEVDTASEAGDDHPAWAKTKESATQEKDKMKNIPTAGDYMQLLAQKGEKDTKAIESDDKALPAGIADLDTQSKDASADQKKDAGPAPFNGASALQSDVGKGEEFDEEEVIEIEDDSTRVDSEKPQRVGMGGLIMRGLGGIMDTGILLCILALFVIIGKVAFSVAGQSAGWAPFLRLSGPIYVLFYLIASGYFTLFIGGAGQTPGMMFFGLKVVSKRGELIGYNLAFLRHGLCLLSILFLGLGFWGIPLDRNRQGWHDKLTQSVVIIS